MNNLYNQLVSIVIPIYNASIYLEDCLKSVLEQSYQNIEVICVDDGSTDDSVSIVQRFEEKDCRVCLLKQDNQHAGVARNNGLKKAKGTFIMFLDADDVFEKKMVELLVKKANETETDIIVFNYYSFSRSINFRKKQKMLFSNIKTSGYELADRIFDSTIGAPWNKFYRMSFVRDTELEFQDTLNSNDIYFTRVSMAVCEKIFFYNRCLVNYRIDNKNSLQGNINKCSTSFGDAFIKIHKRFSELNLKEHFDVALKKYAIDLCYAAFQRIKNIDDFENVFMKSRDVCLLAEIKKGDGYAMENGIDKVFDSVLDNDKTVCALNLLFDFQKRSVSKLTIEYRIGKKLLKFIRAKRYEE